MNVDTREERVIKRLSGYLKTTQEVQGENLAKLIRYYFTF